MSSQRVTLPQHKVTRLRALAGRMRDTDIAAELGTSLAVVKNNARALRLSLRVTDPQPRLRRVPAIDRFLQRMLVAANFTHEKKREEAA